ncbi:hypothetical protein A3H38_03210 [candidate division WOR-1 bacterium RIFCSPLOWO2_02_FULL_46_20]|uniref:Uncharacterized protein n=2 Tax=Saganbacteria TaxID=1703751 RepID=A0A1F4RG94_UNCSA|nr:MAG: hypothetical protein A3J44_02605 [candidate division WOR-1 bacterium RIFCSPHIGHO2_02_FULL_45_12]OGC07197.1 MAG: hypothetical protein A3H38_03210 [candidate division WOR-1 bacterium RIFCSPLOWO2_02_FULL_46_20]OGC09957.1 MAG: hypothetical protein A3F86_03015 [candidate division WOR-1 bacterium RIFCSPLOWO2_12_FULL_45_9]
MAITNKDIEKLSEIFATKDDLKRFATKDDLKRFSTKDDLADLKSEIKDDILTSQDKIMKRLDDIVTEQRMGRLESRRHGEKLEDHETRIATLEAKV